MNKPKPTHLKLLQGNPGGRPVNQREAKVPSAIPKAPKYLSAGAKKHWRQMSKLLYDSGLISNLDRQAFGRLCSLSDQLEQAELNVQRYGVLVKSPNGYPQQSPYFTALNQISKQLMNALADFGMTPSSRSREKGFRR